MLLSPDSTFIASKPVPCPAVSHHEVNNKHDGLSKTKKELEKENRELQKQLWNERAEFDKMQRKHEAEIRSKNQTIQEKDEERERSIQELTEHFQEELKAANDEIATIRDRHQQDMTHSWEMDRKDIEILPDKIIGTGGWGTVVKANFKGVQVAVKQLHSYIVSDFNEDMVKREISIMAQVRHPNLLLFIGAVIVTDVRSEGESSLIITELLDTSLRSAYQKNRISADSKKPILCDVACALAYLHTNRIPVIHRDVSSSNVLLQAVRGSRQWKAKLSDFGSANILSKAVTPNAGAVIYAAPETITEHLHQQTTKVDVYSFGVLLCEVVLFHPPPDERKDFIKMLSQVQTRNRDLFSIAKNCTKRSKDERPSMTEVLKMLA